MRKLILIKHAAPLVDPQKSSEQWKLSEKGRESCAPLADALRALEPKILVSSEEPKAQETAQLAASRLSVPTQTAKNLHEHDRSNVPHMRSGEFISHMELFFRKPEDLVLGKETAAEAQARIESALRDLLEKHPSGNIAVVTHGTVLALFLAARSSRNGFDLWREMGLPSFAVLSLPDYRLEQLQSKVAASPPR